MSFTKMKKAELIAMATEDFGVEVPEKATVPQVLGLLANDGVTWAMAVENSEYAKKYAAVPTEAVTVEADPGAPRIVTGDDLSVAALERTPEPSRPGATVTTETLKTESESIVDTPVVEPITAPKAVLPDKVLLRMDRDNGTFIIRGYKFTKQHPYALVSATDAEYITEQVEGFHYATPKEAQEFYG